MPQRDAEAEPQWESEGEGRSLQKPEIILKTGTANVFVSGFGYCFFCAFYTDAIWTLHCSIICLATFTAQQLRSLTFITYNNVSESCADVAAITSARYSKQD